MAVFDIRKLSFSYPNAENRALDNVSIAVESGEFVTLVGPTGSGKSTLLRLLKPELQQNGEIQGEILFHHKPITELEARDSAAKIGYVAQSPEEQIVTDKVWHEMAFTLENLGKKQQEIARRVAETAAYFGIAPWYHDKTATLSGGQKQLLNLASVMVTEPEALILDEPTAQLDPIEAAKFVDTLYKLNRETGVTVIISEHRAEELLPISDRMIVLDKGQIVYDDTPRAIAGQIKKDSPYLPYLTAAARIFIQSGGRGECPLSVREGMRSFRDLCMSSQSPDDDSHYQGEASDDCSSSGDCHVARHTTCRAPRNDVLALELKDVYFRYEKSVKDVLSGLDLMVYEGEIFAILGANGCGKSTAAGVIAGVMKPYSGKRKLFSKAYKEYKDGSLYRENLSLLPQDVESVFLRASVREELAGCEEVMKELPFDLSPLLDRHPYDLSGGERQMVALCKALKSKPRLLILDEPSKGLDPQYKTQLGELLCRLRDRGLTIILITHDVEFAAGCADRCGLFFDGAIAACESTVDFMNGNRYFTTAASRITRNIVEGCYTVDTAAEAMGGERG